MDNKRLISVLLLTTAFMMLWALLPWMGRQLGWDIAPAPPANTSEVPSPEPSVPIDPLAAQADPSTSPATAPTTQPQPAAGSLRILNSAPRRTVVLGSAAPSDAIYSIELTASNVGAGIEQVVLNQFRQELDSEDRYTFEQPYPELPDATRPLATASIQVLGQTIDLGGVGWMIDEARTDGEQATFYVDVGTDAGPVARILKLIKIYPRTKDGTPNGEPDPRGGYEILVRVTLENLSNQPLTWQTALNGPTTPPRELDYGYDRMIIAGHRERNASIKYVALRIETFVDEDIKRELIKPGEPPLLWAGASSIYFNAIVRPQPFAREQQGPDVPAPEWIRHIVAASVNPDEKKDENRHVALRFFTTDLEVGPGQSSQLPFRVFLGPKQRELLKGEYYAQPALHYDETLESPFGCTWCVFQPVVDVLVWLLTLFYTGFKDWGLAIVALVLVVRLLLHPITKRSQRSMMRMAKLGPEMEKLKKKYGDDKEAMAKAMGEFYREHGMAALPLGCLPMLLQTPIWIALYSTLQAEFRLRHAPFLYGWTWIDDLAKPDHLIDFGISINLWLFSVKGLNILPLLLGVVFWLQMKFQPMPQAMTPEQKTQQAMMKWMMVLMFPLFLYSAPSGLNLYILTSTMIGIWESKRVRDQFRREDEAKEAQQPTLVPDKAPRSARGNKRQQERHKAKPLTGWRAKWAKLLQQVQQAQQEAAKRNTDRNRDKR